MQNDRFLNKVSQTVATNTDSQTADVPKSSILSAPLSNFLSVALSNIQNENKNNIMLPATFGVLSDAN